MKIKREDFIQANESGLAAPKRGEGGSVTVVLIALLAIMVILVAANSKSLFILHREVKLLEQQQIKRLDASQTNSVAITNPGSK